MSNSLEYSTLPRSAAPGLPCPSCRFANPPGFRFCGACGSGLAADGERPIRPRQVTAERRQLTVLFCDLVGSTHLANSLELEELRDVIRSYQSACAESVRRYGGMISRFMGDGILVLFGYPRAHEDDAERAVRAALGMVDAVARLPRPAAVTEPLTARVGIASGVVVAGDLIGDGSAEEEAVLGETVNLAGRLQAVAEPGNVVVAQGTHALLGGGFVCDDLGAHSLKGFGEPVACWRVVRPRPVSSRFTAGDDAIRAPLFGREDDVAWLLGLWQSAAAGRGRVAVLTGEAGIGKSRVAEAVCERLGDASVPLRFQCSPHYTNRALHPVIHHIELAARIGLEDPAVVKLEKLSAWLDPAAGGLRELALLAALLSIPADVAPPLPAMSVSRQKQDTFDLLLRAWRTEAGARPLLVMFEDLHWADPTTLEFLSVLVERIDGMAALAIVTARPHFAVPWDRWHVTGHELSRLPREAALGLIEHVMGAGGLPEAVVDQVVRRADGIPLFVEELTQAVLGLEVQDPSGPPVVIPSTLHGSLMARLDQLGAAKFVAQVASAIGREFGYPLLRAIAPLPEERLRAELAALEQAGLVRSTGSAVGDAFAFKHALVQEVAYETLLRSRRRELHTLIAQVLQERFPQQTRNTPELLAHHWTEAGDVERAVSGWLAAGERASERSEYREAMGHLRRGVELVGRLADPVQRRDRELALLLALGPVSMMVTGAGTPEIGGLYTRALQLCEEVPKSGQHFAARWGRWRAAMDHRAGLERADDLLNLARELKDPALLLQAHHCQWATSTCSARTRSATCTPPRASGSTTSSDTACTRISTAATIPRSVHWGSGPCRAGCSDGSTRASTACGSPCSGRTSWGTWAAACTRWTTRSRCIACVRTRARSHSERTRWRPLRLSSTSVSTAQGRCSSAHGHRRCSAMSHGASRRCVTRWHRWKRQALLRSSRCSTRCSPRCASAPDVSPKVSMPWTRDSRKPSADASSTGTPSCIAVAASSCSPWAATSRQLRPTASNTPWSTRGSEDVHSLSCALPPASPASAATKGCGRPAPGSATPPWFQEDSIHPTFGMSSVSLEERHVTVDDYCSRCRPGRTQALHPRHASRLRPGGHPRALQPLLAAWASRASPT